MSRSIKVTLVVGAIALAVAGCGESKTNTMTSVSDAGSSGGLRTSVRAVKLASGAPLTHAQWVAQGDAICDRMNTQLSASVVKSLADLRRVLPQAALYEQSALTQLAALTPPDRDRHDWLRLLTDVEHWATNSTAMAAEARSASFKLNTHLIEVTRVYHEGFASIAKRNGFKVCSVA